MKIYTVLFFYYLFGLMVISLSYPHYIKKSDKYLEQNFVYEQISKFLSEFLLYSHDILRLKFFFKIKFNKFKT